MNFLDNVIPKVVGHLDRQSQASKYIDDPALWAEEYLGIKLWSRQRDIAASVRDNHSTAVKAGHGVGKSLLAAVLIAWWIDVHPKGSARFFTTAPSGHQVSSVIGYELRKLLTLTKQRCDDGLIDHPLPGYIDARNTWKDDDGTQFGYGRKPPDHTTENAVQGIHGEYVLAIIDEACGIQKDMFDAVGAITSNATSRRMAIGNPTNPASYFGDIFANDIGWELFTLSVLDSPNFTDEKHEMPETALKQLTDPSWVESRKKEWGEDDPRYKSRVLGEFAYDLGDTFIPYSLLDKAIDVEIAEEGRPILGVDIARHGVDSSVVYANYNGRIRFVGSWDNANSIESANRVDALARELNASEVRIDSIGVGGGVLDQLTHLCGYDYMLVEMVSSYRSPDPKQWHNARAFWWSNVKDKLFANKLDIDAEDETLIGELAVPQYKYAPQGGLLIESKDEMRKRGVGSPDFADAAVYAATDLWVYEEEEQFKPGTVVSKAIPEDDIGWDTVLAW